MLIERVAPGALADPCETAREVAPVLAELAARTDETAEFPTEGFKRLRETGLMGLSVPKEYGGSGCDPGTLHTVARILAGSCLSTAMVWAMHSQQVAVLADYAPDSLKREVLPAVARGSTFVASVTSESGKGGHLLTANAALVGHTEQLSLVRAAPVVTGGARAEAFLITMRRTEASPPSDVVLVFARRDQLETKVESGWPSLGMRGTESVGMHFAGNLPRDQVLAPPGGFKQLAASTLIPFGHLLWASCWLGAVEGAYRSMIGLLSTPTGRVGYDVGSDLFLERLARVRLEIDASGAFIREVLAEFSALRATRPLDDTCYLAPSFNIRINEVKLFASEVLFSAVDRLVQIGGLRYGYLKNGRVQLERVFRDLRSARLMYGNDRLLVADGKLCLVDRKAFDPSGSAGLSSAEAASSL